MTRKKLKAKKFIDEVSRFSKYKTWSIGDKIVYTRVSDDQESVGIIKWFSMSSEGMAASVIDSCLGNYQLGICDYIQKNPPSNKVAKLLGKKKI